MGSTFNPQILAEKLSKLNNTQQSIETLSHWCIFHMNKAKQVVETWDRQFRSAPREQRLAFLYLANDILQNSRRKGAEFVAEFWKVLPDALRHVVEHGDEFGKNAAFRLISIWEERKVFGSRGQILKEEFVKRQLDNGNRNWKHAAPKMRSPVGNTLDKLVSAYQAVYSSQLDEDGTFNRCKSAITFIQKVDKNVEGDYRLDGIADELKGQHTVLRDCIEQLSVVESSRANLVSLLREVLQEQVYKLDQVRDQLQAAQTHSEQADGICRQLIASNGNNGQVLALEQSANGVSEQSTSVTYTLHVPAAHVEENPKSAAAAVAAKLAASTSSAEMLTLVLSSLASEGVIGNAIIKESSSSEYPSEKRAKIENEQHTSYFPQNPQPPEINSDEAPPPPPSSPPPPQPPPPMQQQQQPYQVPQYMQTAMPIIGGGPYGYNNNNNNNNNNVSQQQTAAQPGYAPVGGQIGGGVTAFDPSSNTYQSYPAEGGLYGQPSSLAMAPMSRQLEN